MSEEKINQELSDDELKDVAGGVKKMQELKRRAKSGRLDLMGAGGAGTIYQHAAGDDLAKEQGKSETKLHHDNS